jgi:hypothetical protein
MKKSLLAILVISALTISVQAGDKGKKHGSASPEAKAFRKEMLEKYDTNKDGKIDKEEKAKVSAEDKEKMKKAQAEAHKDAEKKDDKK